MQTDFLKLLTNWLLGFLIGSLGKVIFLDTILQGMFSSTFLIFFIQGGKFSCYLLASFFWEKKV
jgi:hypothetical protein